MTKDKGMLTDPEKLGHTNGHNTKSFGSQVYLEPIITEKFFEEGHHQSADTIAHYYLDSTRLKINSDKGTRYAY